MKTLTVTEAARNLRRFLESVYIQRKSYTLVNKGIPYAQLIPANAAGCTAHELADDLEAAPLRPEDRRAFAAAFHKGRKTVKPARNPWA